MSGSWPWRPSAVALPPGAPGRWVRLRAALPAGLLWWAKLEMTDAARAQVVREAFLGPMRQRRGRGVRTTLLHVPREAGALTLTVYGADRAAEVHIIVLSRGGAAARLLAGGLHLVPGALRGSPLGALGRLRAVLGQAPARRGEAPPYACWLRWFPPQAVAKAAAPPIVIVIGEDTAARGASFASVAAQQGVAAPQAIAAGPGPWPVGAGDRVVVLNAGTRLAPFALAHFAADASGTDVVYADTDTIMLDGTRRDPLFKPNPGPALLRSGILTTGACLVRWPLDDRDLPRDAEALALTLALRPAARVARIPQILAHVPPRRGSVAAWVPVVQAELARQNMRAEVSAGTAALRVRRRPAARLPQVSVIVASACRSRHVPRCLRRVLATVGPEVEEVLVAVSRIDPADRAQRAILAQLRAFPRVRVLDLAMAQFNYPEVNNAAVEQARGEILLILNDDVAPFGPGWLGAMLAQLEDRDVGAVGARLLYGNGLVQHGGVVMGLGHLCEHAFRLRRRDDPAPGGLALLDREVSAVTAACMAVRAHAFRAAGGFDPGFAVALNDVDLCLKLSAAGWRIVQCAGAELAHYESLSLGRHYRGERAALEAREVHRLRSRWADVIADDPYYNPQASLQPGREWLPAFPPRGSGFSATLPNSSAVD